MATELIYMTDGERLEYRTTVQEVQGRVGVVLASTIFYPQGGGQPYDTGVIKGENGTFKVTEVRNVDGTVMHMGLLEGEIAPGDEVVCRVDANRRQLNSRIHSAGHVLDMAVREAAFGWKPGKGYHFPDGPYVEYSGDFGNLNHQEVRERIEQGCANLVARDLPVRIEFMERPEMERRLDHVPDYLPTNRPARVVFIGEVGIPCGGTHVRSLGEIGKIEIRKVKLTGDVLRVSYQVGSV